MVLHKYFLFSTLGFHDPKLDDHIFQMVWFNSTTNQSSEILGPGNLTSLRRLHRTVAWRKNQRFRAVWGVWGWGFIPFAMLKICLEKDGYFFSNFQYIPKFEVHPYMQTGSFTGTAPSYTSEKSRLTPLR